jgi:dolichol-phosphate mannosyltransferase
MNRYEQFQKKNSISYRQETLMKRIRNCSAWSPISIIVDRIRNIRRNSLLTKFALVGLLGTLVNLALMALLVEVFSTLHVYASCIATEVSIIHNFLLNNSWTFSSRHHADSRLKRFWHFNLLSIGTLSVNVLVATYFISQGQPYIPAQGIGIIAAFGINYLINNHVIFAGSKASIPIFQGLKMPFFPEERLPVHEPAEVTPIQIQPDGP